MRPAPLLVLLAVGCPDAGPSDPAFDAVSVTTPLLRGRSQVVEVSARLVGPEVDRVVADLSPIGGAVEQPLALEDGLWSWSGRLVPDLAGEWSIELRATTAGGRTLVTRVTVAVNDPSVDAGSPPDGGDENQPPEVEDESLETSGTAGVRGPARVACAATDRDGVVVRVTADLSSLGGPARVELDALGGDRFEWAGELTPSSAGPASVPIVATDDDGATGAGAAEAEIAPGFRLLLDPATLSIDVFDPDPRSITAAIEPPLPANATARLEWRTGSFVGGVLVTPGRFVDAEGGDQSSLVTDALTVRFGVRPQPWHWSLRLPITTRVLAHATLDLGGGLIAEASGNDVEVAITQAGLEVDVGFGERTREELGTTTRVFEAGFEWPIEAGSDRWLVAFLAKPNEDDTPWEDKWILPSVTVENGQKTLAPDGFAGLLLGGTKWRSDGGIALTVYEAQVAALRAQYAGFRAKVTAWPK